MTKRFTVIDNEYLNTGGHCMVDVTAFYDSQLKKTLYMYVGNNWLTLTAYDYLRNELQGCLSAEDFILCTIEESNFTTEPDPMNRQMLDMPDEYFDLFNHGMLSYIKNKFKYDHQLTKTTVENLPLELRHKVSDDYAAWLSDNNLLVTTDGENIIVEDDYAYSGCYNYLAAKDLQQFLECWMPSDNNQIDNKEWDEWYEGRVTIVVKDRAFTFYNGADIYNGLCLLVNHIIDEQ